MDLHELKGKGFLPIEVVTRMGKTTPGAMAKFLNELMYLMVEAEHPETKDNYWKTPNKVYVGLQPLAGVPFPHNFPYKGVEEDGSYANVQRVLVEIRDYLEACALMNILK